MSEDCSVERRRARWRRNKAAERAGKKPVTEKPSLEFVAAVMAERDRRASHAAGHWLHAHPHFGYWTRTGRSYWINVRYGSWLKFVADVWAATVLLEKQFGAGKATSAKIVWWLSENHHGQGYAASSLRLRVYRARDFITALEAEPIEDRVHWLPFVAPPS